MKALRPLGLAALVALAVAAAAPAGAKESSDPLERLAFMIGSWTCTFTAAGQTSSYEATMSWAVAKNWIQERDSWPGGGDEAYFTWDKAKQRWTAVVVDQSRATTIFVAPATGDRNLTWKSIFPDASMTETLTMVSPTKYSVAFKQTVGTKTTSSSDVCTKH